MARTVVFTIALFILSVFSACADDSSGSEFDEPSERLTPLQTDLPACEADYACYYDGYVAQAIVVDNDWTIAATPGDWRVQVYEPRAGAGTLQFEGEYRDSLIDCVADPRISEDASVAGPFDTVDFSDGCKTTRRSDILDSVEFTLEIDGLEFSERHQPADPPGLSIEETPDFIEIVPDDPSQTWQAYVVEDEPGPDRKTFFMSIIGNEELPDYAIYRGGEEIDAPFSIYAIGKSGGASMIEVGSESIALGLVIEKWVRIGGGDPADF